MTRKCAKLVFLLFAICTLCFAAFGVAACNKKNQGHEHTYGEWQITKPTETEVGSAVKTCSTCDKNKDGHTVTVTLPVLGDEGYSKSVDTATCEAGGEVVYTIYINNEKIFFSIETSAKGHSFNEDFWLGDGSTHWHGSTCGHNVKGDEEPCTDENGDSNCDICGYLIHKHSYEWNGNDDEHWLEPTCTDTTEIKEKEPHIDANNDDVCDTCGKLLPHTHKYSEDWSFDEDAHWHAPTCKDTTEGADEDVHTFKDGICECGAVEAETNAYRILKEKADLQDSYTSWLNSIKEDGVTNVTVTEAGDVIYNYGDGITEVAYVAERTVKVKAVSSGEGVAHVWIMLTLYKDGAYQEVNGTYALGVAETDENGVAEITFIPVSGYTSKTVDYRVRLAEKKDIASYLGIAEETTPKPIPNRYSASGNSDNFINVEVGENATSDDIAGEFSFTFSKGWNAYEQFTLPYARYYEKPYEGEGLKETGTTFEFTASGENLFDYFYFTPSNKYSFASADSSFTPEQLAVIVENFQKAASGIYRIYFSVEGNAAVTLYYWNEQGVNMGAYHVTKADGTPSDEYITSISGGTAGDGKYTGSNYVDVVIKPENGLREYQFGIISDKAAKITFTVERTGDYVVDSSLYQLSVGVKSKLVDFTGYDITPFALVNVPDGLYSLTVTPNNLSPSEMAVGMLSAYIVDSDKALLWENNKYKGIIRISAEAEVLYIYNGGIDFKGVVLLEEYVIPELGAGKETYLPASGSAENAIEINLSKSVPAGTCLAEITLYGSSVAGNSYTVTLIVGAREYVFSTTQWPKQEVTYSGYIQVSASETVKIISNNRGSYSMLIVKAKLTSFPSVQQDTPTNIHYTTTSTLDNIVYYAFTASKAGTYKLTLELLSEATTGTDLYYMLVDNAYDSEQVIIKNGVRENGALITKISGSFDLEEGESIVLKFTRKRPAALINLNFIIEYAGA